MYTISLLKAFFKESSYTLVKDLFKESQKLKTCLKESYIYILSLSKAV